MITTISLVTICQHTKLLQYYWLYSLSCMLYPLALFIFCNLKFASFNLLHIFHPSMHPLSPFAATVFSSVSMSLFLFCLLCVLGSTYKWSHTVFVFAWLISFNIILYRFIYVVTNGKISFLLWLNNNPYIHT